MSPQRRDDTTVPSTRLLDPETVVDLYRLDEPHRLQISSTVLTNEESRTVTRTQPPVFQRELSESDSLPRNHSVTRRESPASGGGGQLGVRESGIGSP